MADNKRFFWLKLKEDFFEDETIEWLEEQPNGKEYVLFYLKMCLKSLKHDGKLYREIGTRIIPYDIKKLSEITKTPVDTVMIATKVLSEIGLVQRMDDETLYMNQVMSMVGSNAANDNAERQRRFRERQKQKLITQSVTKNNGNALRNSNESIEYRDKSIENRDKSIELDSIGDKSPKTPAKPPKKRAFIPPTLEEVNDYILERGIHNVSAKAFFDYYEAGDWHDAKGNKVKSWKQKLLTWARHEDSEVKPSQNLTRSQQINQNVENAKQKLQQIHSWEEDLENV